MAKAREIPGVEPQVPYAVAAANVVEVRTIELLELSANVLDVEDIERVHDMRVATRRLRAAIEVFAPCFPKKERKSILKDVKALADALGERRDRDVSIAALDEFAGALARPDRPGVASLIQTLRAEQAEANEALGPFVAGDRLDELRRGLEGLVAAARARAEGEAA